MKFKVGDRVRVIDNTDEPIYDTYIGRTGYIKDVNNFGFPYAIEFDDEVLYWCDEELELFEESVADVIYRHINRGDDLHMENKNDLMNIIAPKFYDIVHNLPDKDMVYIGGHMLNKANAEQRIKEAREIESLGYDVWNPIEDKSINSKNGLDKHTNDNLSKRIVHNDTVGILKSNYVVIEPESFAIGSICETGMLFAYKHVANMLKEILSENRWNDNMVLVDDIEKLINICDKDVYTHIDDLRAENSIDEMNYNRSWSVNQFLRGIAQGLTNKEEGFYSFDEVIEKLK